MADSNDISGLEVSKFYFPEVYVSSEGGTKNVFPRYGSKQGETPTFIIGPIIMSNYDAGIPTVGGKHKETEDKCYEISIPLKPDESKAAAVVLDKINEVDRFLNERLNNHDSRFAQDSAHDTAHIEKPTSPLSKNATYDTQSLKKPKRVGPATAGD
jgi:hypothetical protein